MEPQTLPTPQPPKRGSKISNAEWGLVAGAAFAVDAIQVVLDMFAIGVVGNRFIDIFMGMALSFYFYIRGVKMDSKKVLGLVGSFFLEEIPIVDALPLWGGDVIATMLWDKADNKLG